MSNANGDPLQKGAILGELALSPGIQMLRTVELFTDRARKWALVRFLLAFGPLWRLFGAAYSVSKVMATELMQ